MPSRLIASSKARITYTTTIVIIKAKAKHHRATATATAIIETAGEDKGHRLCRAPLTHAERGHVPEQVPCMYLLEGCGQYVMLVHGATA